MKLGFGGVAIWCALALLAQPTGASDSRDLLRALIKPEIATQAPEAAIRRFTKLVALERAQPVPGMLLLAGGDAEQRVELRYQADATGAQRFAQGALRISAPSSDAEYRSLERLLRKKLGKPRYERRDDGPLPTIGWRLGKLEVALSQAERWVEVSIANPDQAASNL